MLNTFRAMFRKDNEDNKNEDNNEKAETWQRLGFPIEKGLDRGNLFLFQFS